MPNTKNPVSSLYIVTSIMIPDKVDTTITTPTDFNSDTNEDLVPTECPLGIFPDYDEYLATVGIAEQWSEGQYSTDEALAWFHLREGHVCADCVEKLKLTSKADPVSIDVMADMIECLGMWLKDGVVERLDLHEAATRFVKVCNTLEAIAEYSDAKKKQAAEDCPF